MIRETLRSVRREPRVPVDPRPPWWDIALTAALVPASILEGLLRDVPWPAFQIAMASVCALCILGRRAAPLAMLVIAFTVQTAAGIGPDLAGEPYGVLYTTSCVLLFPYSLARWAAGPAVAAGIAFMLAAHLLREPRYDNPATDIIVGVGFLLFPAALGAAVRLRTTLRTRELDRVRTRERERIARDLHDTVAHHVSAILVQAQAGRVVAADDPARALKVLTAIEDAATRSLGEMRAVVGVLRSGEDAGRSPTPGAPDIVRLGTDAGHWPPVTVTLDGDVGDIDPSAGTTLYRVAQEAVTNARRHARGATGISVGLRGEDDLVRLTVDDDGRGSGSGPPGFGLTGMAERVALIGGTFTAGPRPGGGWRVRAAVPRRPGS